MTKQTEATPGTEVALATGALAPVADEWDGFDTGLVGKEAGRLSLPRISSDMRPGQGYTDEITGERRDHLSFIWLAAKWTRGAHLQRNEVGEWERRPFGEGDKRPDCWSGDMERPDPAALWEDKPTSCAICPMSQFGPNGEAPPCRERLNVFGFDVEDQHYFRTWFSGTGLKHADGYRSALLARRPRRPLFAQVTEVKLVEIRGETDRTRGRIWLEPQITPGVATTPDEVRPLLATRNQFLTQWETAAVDDTVEAPDVPEGAAVPTARAPYIDPDDPDSEPF